MYGCKICCVIVASPLDVYFRFPKIKGSKNIVKRTVFHCDMFHHHQNVPGEYDDFDETFIGKGLKQITSAALFYLGNVKIFCFDKVKTYHFDCTILIN